VAVNSRLSQRLEVVHLALGETLKALVGKLLPSVLLQVVSVNPNRQLGVVAYLAVAWEAANHNLKAVSLVKVHRLVQVVSEQTLGDHLSSVVKIFLSNLT
jgi:hypothetical protein